MSFAATWANYEIIILSEVSQKKKDKYNVITYMLNLKYEKNKFIYKTKAYSHRKQIYDYQAMGEGVGEP